jgi:hypothetical protein
LLCRLIATIWFAGLFDHRIFERHALAVVLAEPLSSGILIGEDLEVVLVANLLACIDVDC